MKKVLILILLLAFTCTGYSRLRSKKIDVIKGELVIENVAGFAFDYNNFQLAINAVVFNLSNLTLASGNLNAGIGETIVISGLTFPASASVSIWYSNSLSQSSNANLVDFMQYGSAGNPYEASADSAGLWTIGDFVAGNPPYTHTGGAFDEGVAFWQANSVDIEEFDDLINFSVYPNPATSNFNLKLGPNLLGKDLQLVIVDLQGKLMIKQPVEQLNVNVPVNHFPDGIYYTMLVNKAGVLRVQTLRIK